MWCAIPTGQVVADPELATTETQSQPKSDQRHWAYAPVTRPTVPVVRGISSAEVAHPVDRLLLARLQAEGLGFSVPATPSELLRRLKFDLLGLPPTPEEVAEFTADPSEAAYLRWVERFLASPHFGERQGRQWLDLVRYSDTAGYNADPLRPLAWKYRDYVIAAFNDDTPYDRFLAEQLAGDELFPDSKAALVATGFLRLPPDESNASDVILARQDMLNDITAAVGSVILGQSLGCAQCHDHKYDALAQTEFYSLQAFFAGMIPVESADALTPEQRTEQARLMSEWEASTRAIREEYQRLMVEARAKVYAPKRLRFPELVWKAMDTRADLRDAFQHQLAFFSERQLVIEVKEKEMVSMMSETEKVRWPDLKKQFDAVSKQRPKAAGHIEAMAATDGRGMPPTHLLAGGNHQKPLDEVQPGFPRAMDFGFDMAAARRELGAGEGPFEARRRSVLARWLTDPRHPLVARVMANRLWQSHFGAGLLANANDFGVQTAPPVLPELLDWLASELVAPTEKMAGEAGAGAAPPTAWSLKHLHRVIVTSAAYRQSSLKPGCQPDRDRAERVDPSNAMFWHHPRKRLDAESLRDALLAVSDRLNPRLGGPPVKPELPAAIGNKGLWELSSVEDRARRSVYILQKRNQPFPMLQTFDLPDTFESCACRAVTTTAPQALLLMNSERVVEYARSFAGRILEEDPSGNSGVGAATEPAGSGWVRLAIQRAYGRPASSEELFAGTTFLKSHGEVLSRRAAGETPARLPSPMPKFVDPVDGAALVDLGHALLNSNEFVYVD
jgi:hypothetical protein